VDNFNARLFAQRYASTGSPLGGEFPVAGTPSPQYFPSVASDSAGNFVVAWTEGGLLGPKDVFAQRYASTGLSLGGAFRVNSYLTNDQGGARVAADAAGNFVVVWGGQGFDGTKEVFAQRYASTGVPLGGEFRVNTYTTSGQGGPSVASDSAGNFVVAWTGRNTPGGGYDVYAQRYSAILPVELLGFRVE
jgi:hypothetical protein